MPTGPYIKILFTIFKSYNHYNYTAQSLALYTAILLERYFQTTLKKQNKTKQKKTKNLPVYKIFKVEGLSS